MDLVIHIIALFGAFLFGSTLIVKVGEYTELNPKDCGLSRLSSKVDTNCFKWHNNSRTSLKRGKNVTPGDAPWVVFIEATKENNIRGCTGALFADQWILTAAHCLIGRNTSAIIAKDIKVYFGFDFEPNNRSHKSYLTTIEQHIHPKTEWILPDNETLKHDLGLLKLNQSIVKSPHKLMANSICLPMDGSGSYQGHFEYVIFSGWGGPTQMLKMAYWKMYSGRLPNMSGWPTETYLTNLDNQTACQGDSGGPVWQYDMGRAVIAAVAVSINFLVRTGTPPFCQNDLESLPVGAIRVDWEMNWIRNVTKLK